MAWANFRNAKQVTKHKNTKNRITTSATQKQYQN